jgi:hypothetical protein
MPTKRPSIPPNVQQAVLLEAGYMCGNPRCRNIITLEIHHIDWVKDGGKSEVNNLIALCPNCHELHTKGYIPHSAIVHWKGMLHALNHAFNREGMAYLLFLSLPTFENIWYSGDAVLHFAGLIAAGLVGIAESQQAVGLRYATSPLPIQPPSTGVRLRLTDKGRLLVDSWLHGNQEEYIRGLTHLASSPTK